MIKNWSNHNFLKLHDNVHDNFRGAGTVIKVKPHEFYAYHIRFENGDIEAFSQKAADELTILKASSEALEIYKRMVGEMKSINSPDLTNILSAAEMSGELSQEELIELQSFIHQNMPPREAGTWAVPYDADKAKDLAGIIKKFEEKEISKTLYDVLGNDSLYDQIDTLQTQFASVLTEYVKKILKHYEKNPTDFQGQFEVEAINILNEIVYGKQQDDKQEQEKAKPAPKPVPKKKKEYDLL